MAAKRLWATWVCAAAITMAGCGSEAPPAATGVGTGAIEIALAATASGTTYVLAKATFTVANVDPGANAALVLHQSDPTAGDITASVPVGRYTVTLFDGWQLEREDSPTSLVPVHATLQSANPVTVSVFSGQTTTVTFQFQTTGIPLTFGPGAIDIGIQTATCDAEPPPGVELNVITNSDFEVDATGWTVADASGTFELSPTAHCGLHSGRATYPKFFWVLPDPATETTYAFSAWVRHSQPQAVNMGMYMEVATSGISCPPATVQLIDYQAVAPDTWTRLSGTTSDASQCAFFAGLYFYADSLDVFDVLIDDVYAIPQ